MRNESRARSSALHTRAASGDTFADVDVNRHGVRRRRDDLEPATGDLFDVGLQFGSTELSGSRRFLRDDNFRPRLTVLDNPGAASTAGVEKRAEPARTKKQIAEGFMGYAYS